MVLRIVADASARAVIDVLTSRCSLPSFLSTMRHHSAGARRWSLLLASLAIVGCSGGGDHSSTSGPKPLTPASVSAQTTTTITAVVGTAVSPAPAVRVLSSSGDPVPGVSVSFAVSTGGGIITSGSVSTGSDGVAAVGSWTLGTTAGQQRLTASVTGLTAVDFTATANPDVPASITPQNSATLNGIAGAAVVTVPAAIVRDRYSNPNPGVTVTFAVTQGGGTVAGPTATTDASGAAHPTSWTLGQTVGTNTLTATVAGVAIAATFSATAAAGPPSAMTFVAGSGQSATVNTAVTV